MKDITNEAGRRATGTHMDKSSLRTFLIAHGSVQILAVVTLSGVTGTIGTQAASGDVYARRILTEEAEFERQILALADPSAPATLQRAFEAREEFRALVGALRRIYT